MLEAGAKYFLHKDGAPEETSNFFAEGQVKGDTGELVATGTGTLRYRSEGVQKERT